VQNVKDYVDTTAQNIKENVDETREIKVTSLWTGETTDAAQTITLSQSVTDFRFILFECAMYTASISQRQYQFIPSSQCVLSISETYSDSFIFAASVSGVNRRLRFTFSSETSVYKLESEGTSGHKPKFTNIWGIK
jgi:hypothetical protein